jgi:hypothetical protein
METAERISGVGKTIKNSGSVPSSIVKERAPSTIEPLSGTAKEVQDRCPGITAKWRLSSVRNPKIDPFSFH